MTINLKDYAKMTASIKRDRNKYKRALVVIRENTAQPQNIKCHDCFIAWQIAKEALEDDS
jgi:hypothetical protein